MITMYITTTYIINSLNLYITFLISKENPITITSTIKPLEKEFSDNNGDKTFTCHERIDEYNELRIQARFWLEGILLLIVGIFGVFGNIISILVLPRCPGNRNFNVLLM